MNEFMVDKVYGEKFEDLFVEILNKELRPVRFKAIHTIGDDHGVDIVSSCFGLKIDVKAYRPPLFKKHFDGVYLETYQKKSGKDGWLVDETKLTTHYLFIQDAANDLTFYKAWLLSKKRLEHALNEAMVEMDVEQYDRKHSSTKGKILPYEYLDKWAQHIFLGTAKEEEKEDE